MCVLLINTRNVYIEGVRVVGKIVQTYDLNVSLVSKNGLSLRIVVVTDEGPFEFFKCLQRTPINCKFTYNFPEM